MNEILSENQWSPQLSLNLLGTSRLGKPLLGHNGYRESH